MRQLLDGRTLTLLAVGAGNRPAKVPSPHRVETGRRSYHAGLAAEDIVVRAVERSGRRVLARRWRGASGEIDVIAAEGDVILFIEVKQSATHDEAANHFGQRQVDRIARASEEFLDTLPGGAMMDRRLDLALVDATGRLEVRKNILS